jgi:hypothetical protein
MGFTNHGGIAGLAATGPQLNAAAALVDKLDAASGSTVINQPNGLPGLDAVGNWSRLAANIDAAKTRAGVDVAGIPTALYQGGIGSIYKSDGAITVLNPGQAVRQKCRITAITFQRIYNNSAATWKFQIYRIVNATDYVCVAECAFDPPVSAAWQDNPTITLAHPISVEPGDIPGVYLPQAKQILVTSDLTRGGKLSGAGKAVGHIGAVAVGASATFIDITTANGYTNALSDYAYWGLTLTGDHPPYACWLGDSICTSGNGSSFPNDRWQTDLDNAAAQRNPGGSPGDINYCVGERVARRMPANFSYQMYSQGGLRLDTMLSLGIVDRMVGNGTTIPGVNPKVIFIHCGYNDLMVSPQKDPTTDWASYYVVKLDAIRSAIGTSRQVFMDEVLPTSLNMDSSGPLIRALNANLATYCAAHGWTLVKCHDAMGVLNTTTGYLDTLNPLYSSNSGGTSDAAHLSLAGSDKLAAIEASYLLGVEPTHTPSPPMALASAQSLTSEQSGGTVYAVSTTSTPFNLPLCQSGLEYELIVGTLATDAGAGHSLVPQSYDKIVGNGFTALAGKSAINTYATAALGDRIKLKGGPNRTWYITGLAGTWARQA